MTIDQIVAQLAARYPNRNIIKLPENNPQEIICESDPAQLHPGWSKIVAVINSTKPHLHKKTTEEYKVISGSIKLKVDDQQYILQTGQSIIIQPHQVHSAEGDNSWIECTSRPGWTREDHILV